MKSKSFILLLLFLLLNFPFDIEAQCAMCKQAAESSMKGGQKSIATGLNSGILYLMAVPYLMLMFIFRKQIIQLWRMIFKRKVESN